MVALGTLMWRPRDGDRAAEGLHHVTRTTATTRLPAGTETRRRAGWRRAHPAEPNAAAPTVRLGCRRRRAPRGSGRVAARGGRRARWARKARPRRTSGAPPR